MLFLIGEEYQPQADSSRLDLGGARPVLMTSAKLCNCTSARTWTTATASPRIQCRDTTCSSQEWEKGADLRCHVSCYETLIASLHRRLDPSHSENSIFSTSTQLAGAMNLELTNWSASGFEVCQPMGMECRLYPPLSPDMEPHRCSEKVFLERRSLWRRNCSHTMNRYSR